MKTLLLVTVFCGIVASPARARIGAALLPALTSQPQSRTAVAGSDAAFRRHASGSVLRSYQWQLDGTNAVESRQVAASTATSFIVAGVQASASLASSSTAVSKKLASATGQPHGLALNALGMPVGKERWRSERPGELVFAPSGTLYVNSGDLLSALDGESGATKWAQAPEKGPFGYTWSFSNAPAIDSEGVVYVLEERQQSGSHGERPAKIIAFDGRSAIKLWSVQIGADLGGIQGPAIAPGNLLVLGAVVNVSLDCVDRQFYAVGRDVLGWNFATDGNYTGTPSIGPGGVVYLGATVGTSCFGDPGSGLQLFALDQATGQPLWTDAVAGVGVASAIATDGTVYSSGNDEMIALDGRTGVQKWKYSGPASEPVIGPNQSVYVFSGTNLFSLDRQSGALIRTWSFQQNILFPPVFGRDGNLYLVLGGVLSAVDPESGQTIWAFSEPVNVAPIIGPDGTVYASGAKLYAVWGSSLGGPAETGWPMTGANPRRTYAAAYGPPSFPAQPYARRVEVGQGTVLGAECDGAIGRALQWSFAGLPLTGETNSYLLLPSTQFSQAGWYSVTASNSEGQTTSQIALLRVVGPGAPTIQAESESLAGDVVRLGQSTITILNSFTNGSVFYTTDGSEPTFASQPYLGSFVVSNTATIWAIAYSVDFSQSAQDGPFQIQIIPTYTLSTSVIGQGTLGLSPDLRGYVSQRYSSGAPVTLTAIPSDGWRFAHWQGEACGTGPGTTVVMDGDKTVTAVFEAIPRYLLSAITVGGGTISGNAGSTYYEGAVINLTAQPLPGWQFMYWQGDESGATTNLSVTMDRTKSVEAVFGTHVDTTVGGLGTVTLQPGSGPYPFGSTVQITAHPDVGWYFGVWGSAASGRASLVDFRITNANPTVSALFAPLGVSQMNIYVDTEGLGGVVVSPSPQPYVVGTSVTLTANPAPGWSFSRWEGDASGASTNLTVVLDASKTVAAHFEASPSYPLIATTAGGGVISGNTGSPYYEGAVVNLTAQPLPGWQFLYWQGDASGVVRTLAVTMDRAKSVEAVFGIPSIVLNVVGPGAVTLDPPRGPYAYATTVRLTAEPSAGSLFRLWGNAADGIANPLDYVVTNSDASICALFGSAPELMAPRITTQPQSQTVAEGSDVVFTVSAIGSAPLSYQWQLNGTNLAGATDASLKLVAVLPTQAGDYAVVVTNLAGSTLSVVATLTVDNQTGIPTITRQPADQTVHLGEAATFTVSVSGTAPFFYQWYQGVRGNTTGVMVGATNGSFTTAALTTNTSFWVNVSNRLGSVNSQAASVTVLPTNAAKLNFQIIGGRAGLTIEGGVGSAYQIQYSTNLSVANWTRLLDLSLPISPFTFIDSAPVNTTSRFYRALLNP